ncbi:methyl-accepting chemotaxis protein [Pannonibacter tanglangensis]|uniref:HAMP domain-containing protein n=1 Tax=Pannonibacter tanglangensis TaxID=2750084 RepID=A0ABW9ZHA8_9HYPH|nr:methyl-accepting chemotaxis protein [Pannonibacter sp. XCT-34]NBN63021.1 HAMP domain-containing protein [Pannonibacter sp. XCT-34]
MTIKFRILASLVAMTTMLAVMGLAGYFALSTSYESIRTIVSDRVIPMKQLKRVADSYAVSIVDTAHKVRSGALTWEQGQSSVSAALSIIDREWAAYSATYMVPAEKTLADQVYAAMAAAKPSITKLEYILQSRDQAALDAYVTGSLYPTIDPIGEPISKLVDLQIDVASQEYEQARDTNRLSLTIMACLAVLSAGLALFVAYFVVTGVLRPLAAMQDAMKRLADQDFTVAIPGIGRKDEIGKMADAVAVFKDNGLERVRLEAEQAAERAAREKRARLIEELVTTLDSDVGMILRTVAAASSELEATAASLSQTAETSAQTATTVAAASEQAAANVQTVAAASDELAASIAEISQQVQMSANVADQALQAANQTEATVTGLVASASRIGGVLELINNIAGQTNLLALNATIEAARAGEAGRGFAVVATEVKTLAAQTAKATGEIGAHIEEMQNATNQVALAIQGIGEVIRRISTASTAISAAVEEQGAATQEIARNVNQAAVGTQQVSSSITKVTGAATQTGAGSAQVLSSSQELARQSHVLKTKLDAFFSSIRAA